MTELLSKIIYCYTIVSDQEQTVDGLPEGLTLQFTFFVLYPQSGS